MGLISHKWVSLKEWFIRLGFWKKLILIFTINTMIILIVMNVLMGVIFARVNNNMITISSNETKDYISISNSLVGNSLVNSFLVGLEVLADFIVRIDSSVHFFQNRTNIYNSLQSGVPIYNPSLSSQLPSTPDFTKPMIYFYTQNSTFHNQPYVDVLLASLFSGIDQQEVKRTNVIYQSISNLSNIFVRSTPGTNDFVIPSVESVNQRFNSLTKDWITISGLYADSFTKSSGSRGNLLALRTLNYQGSYRVLIEVQIYQQSMAQYFSKLYYYPSAQVVLFKITQQNPPLYQLINTDSFSLDLSNCFDNSVVQYDLRNGTVLNAYSVAINDTFQIGQSPSIIPQHQLANMTDTVGSFRLVLLVDKQELSVPNTFMTTFLDNQSTMLSYIIYGWSFVILLVTIGLSIVTGTYIFYNLKTLSQKLEQYTKSPHKIHQIILQLKELQCYGIIKKLIDNVVTIIEKIEQKKKNKNQVISPLIYPLNIAQKEFINKVSLTDEQKWQEWERLLKQAQMKFQENKKK